MYTKYRLFLPHFASTASLASASHRLRGMPFPAGGFVHDPQLASTTATCSMRGMPFPAGAVSWTAQLATMAEQALASGSPDNNPRVPDAEQIACLYEACWFQ